MVAGVQPVCIHGAQILDLELDEGLGELGLEAEGHSERVGFEFVVPREDIHEEFHDGVHWRKGVGEEDEANNDGPDVVEAERVVKRCIVDEDAEKGEDVECMEL